MTDDEKQTLVKQLNRTTRKILKAAMATIDFTEHVKPIVDEEDGEVYYSIDRDSGLKRHHVLIVDNALIDCAKLFNTAGLPNKSRFYRKIARMVHYALYEIESREMLENEVRKV